MYTTSNQSYGQFAHVSTAKNNYFSHGSDSTELYKSNPQKIISQQNNNEKYFSKLDYGTSLNHFDLKNNQKYTQKSEFNRQLESYNENISTIDTESLGLPNIGNSCYMNSILQCLFNTKKLFEYFINGTNLIESPNSYLTEEFGKLLTTTFSKSITYDNLLDAIYRFKESIGELSLTFTGYSQNDAHEFLQFLLDKINKELNQAKNIIEKYSEFKPSSSIILLDKIAEEWKLFSMKRENSIITNTFQGHLINEIVCSCKNKSYTFENPLDLSLDLPVYKSSHSYGGKILLSLSECLNEFIKEVSIPEYICSKCKQKGKSKKKAMIWKQPQILIIHFKRFISDKYGRLEVLKNPISFPLSGLDLQTYTHRDSKEQRGKYKLYGIINHYGNLESGHYTSIIYNEGKDKWIQYNDSIKDQIEKRDIQEFSQNSSEPYLLFYKRV